MPLIVYLVIPRKIVSGQIVIGVLGVVNGIGTGINLIRSRPPRIAQASVPGELGIGGPGGRVASGRQSHLPHPVVAKLERCIYTILRIAVISVSERMRVNVIIRS